MAVRRYVYYSILVIALGSNVSPFLTLWGMIAGTAFLSYMGIKKQVDVQCITKDSFFHILSLYFILWVILSTQSIEPLHSIESVLSTAYRVLPLFLVMVGISNRKELKTVFLFLLLSVFITDVVAFYQFATQSISAWGHRVLGLNNSPTFFATHMLMAIVVLWWCIHKEYFNNKEKFVLVALMVLSIFLLIISQTRGAWISFCVTSVLYAIICKNVRRKIIAGLAVLLTVFGGLSFVYTNIQHRVSSVMDMQFTSNSERILMWKAAIAITRDHPIAGIGADEFGYVYNTQYISPLAKERPQPDNPRSGHGHPHNNFLKRFSEGGIVGGLAFVAINLYILYKLILQYKSRRPGEDYSYALMGILIFIAVHIEGLTDTNFTSVPIMRELWLLLGLAWIGDAVEGHVHNKYENLQGSIDRGNNE